MFLRTYVANYGAKQPIGILLLVRLQIYLTGNFGRYFTVINVHRIPSIET
jgi:hypothetical protein